MRLLPSLAASATDYMDRSLLGPPQAYQYTTCTFNDFHRLMQAVLNQLQASVDSWMMLMMLLWFRLILCSRTASPHPS